MAAENPHDRALRRSHTSAQSPESQPHSLGSDTPSLPQLPVVPAEGSLLARPTARSVEAESSRAGG